MATRIRLARRGRKRKPIYDIVVADARAKRDGRFIEKLGTFNPNVDPGSIEIFEDRALHWVMVGAQPSETVRKLLSRAGVMLRKHLQVGVNKGAITQDVADKRYEQWFEERKSALGGKLPFYSKSNPVVEEVVEEEVVAETPVVEESPVAEEATTEEAPVTEEAAVEETPATEEAAVEEAPATEEVAVEEAPATEAEAKTEGEEEKPADA